MRTVTISVPGRVWLDFLDPLASGMQAEIGLPEPQWRRRGRGQQVVYTDVPIDDAEHLAQYLHDRGDTLLGQGIDDPYDPMEKAMRDTLRAGIETAGLIRYAIEQASL